jgi:copper chaperone CopZ
VNKVEEVSLETATARVEGSPDPQDLVAAVNEAGYRAEVSG